jgi:hypothetical protein
VSSCALPAFLPPACQPAPALLPSLYPIASVLACLPAYLPAPPASLPACLPAVLVCSCLVQQQRSGRSGARKSSHAASGRRRGGGAAAGAAAAAAGGGGGGGNGGRPGVNRWTQEEHDKLAQVCVHWDMVAMYHHKPWTQQYCIQAVLYRGFLCCAVTHPVLRCAVWHQVVEMYGNSRRWSEIAKHLPGRSGKQCRERYVNHMK